MKLGYQQATISFCMDLTAPDSPSFPVANLLVGEVDGRQVAGVAVIVPDSLDALSKAVLADTHQLIRKYVDEAFKSRLPKSPLSDVLARVYHSLRNSMHVSVIATPAEVEMEQPNQVGGTIINLLHDGLIKALTEAGFAVEPAPPVQPPAKQGWPDPASLELPPSFVWAPPSPDVALAATG